MARRSFSNLDRRKVTWLVVALALIAMSIVLRWPTLALTVFIPGSKTVLLTLLIIYAIVSFFWFRLNLVKSKLLLGLFACLLPLADEGIAYFTRFIYAEERLELTDLAATFLGVNLGWYFVWLLQPYKGLGEQIARNYFRYVKRRALHDAEYHRMYIQRSVRQALISFLFAAAGSIIILLVVWNTTSGQITLQPLHIAPYIWIIIFIFLVFAITLPIRLNRIWLVFEVAPVYSKQMPCFNCDTCCIETEFDENGWGNCPKCSAILHHGQWISPRKIQTKNTSKQIKFLKYISKFVPVITLPFVIIFFSIVAGFTGSGIEFILTLILTHVVMYHGIFRWIRYLSSRSYRYQHIECRECAYELKGILLEKGIGICPECGLRFARIIKEEQPNFAMN